MNTKRNMCMEKKKKKKKKKKHLVFTNIYAR